MQSRANDRRASRHRLLLVSDAKALVRFQAIAMPDINKEANVVDLGKDQRVRSSCAWFHRFLSIQVRSSQTCVMAMTLYRSLLPGTFFVDWCFNAEHVWIREMVVCKGTMSGWRGVMTEECKGKILLLEGLAHGVQSGELAHGRLDWLFACCSSKRGERA